MGAVGLKIEGTSEREEEESAERESSWWNQPGEEKKIRAGGGGGPLGEDRFRSFLGFFPFLWCLPQVTKCSPLVFELWTSIYR